MIFLLFETLLLRTGVRYLDTQRNTFTLNRVELCCWELFLSVSLMYRQGEIARGTVNPDSIYGSQPYTTYLGSI